MKWLDLDKLKKTLRHTIISMMHIVAQEAVIPSAKMPNPKSRTPYINKNLSREDKIIRLMNKTPSDLLKHRQGRTKI